MTDNYDFLKEQKNKLIAEHKANAQKDLAKAIHYPECWDTAAYPTIEDALHECYNHFKCANEDCHKIVSRKQDYTVWPDVKAAGKGEESP